VSVADIFRDFFGNLAIDNADTISTRYGEITSALNKKFRNTESKSANTLQVGSFGRKTGIKGISDLDMLYIMPKSKWDTYKENKQLKLLQDTKVAILALYPKTKVRVDRLVVTVTYTNFHVEVQPVFEQDDGSFKYPDTSGDGSWKITKPKEEMKAMSDMDSEKNYNLKKLCKMIRAWKNKHSVAIGGLLIDTLAYNFLKSTEVFDKKSYRYYHWLSRDFFKYLSELPEQNEYAAPGSKQRVKVKKKFQGKAKKAYKLCLTAIEAENTKGVNDKWKKVYGKNFPENKEAEKEKSAAKALATWQDTEEFIDDKYTVDIRYDLKIDCVVKQNGFRDYLLSHMLRNRIPLKPSKKLHFKVTKNSVPVEQTLFWKVLNRGPEAERRDQIRGQIWADTGKQQRTENTKFKGDHIVECYAVSNNVVVASDRIHVPISNN